VLPIERTWKSEVRLVFACARLVHLEFASAPDLYLGFPDMLRDAKLEVARSATLQ